MSQNLPQDVTPQGLSDVDTFIIPWRLIEGSVRFLRLVGADGAEGFVLWAGVREPALPRFRFTAGLIPDQHAFETRDGLLVTVSGEELFKINKRLHERGEILAGQVHSHPGSAYHSGTDDHYPLVTLLGALSVVVPDFAVNAPDDLKLWAWYRLEEYGRWTPLSKNTQVVFE